MPKDYSIGYKFKGDASGYKKAMVEMNQSTKQFANTIKQFGNTLLGSIGIMAITKYTGEAIKLAAVAEGVRTAFGRIAGSKKILNEIKESTRGVIDESDLMALALKAQNFGIPLKDLAKMFEFSSSRAITAGKSVSEFADKFVTGIGRRMPKSLIELQISASDAKKMFSKQGLGGVLEYVNSELGKMGTVADTAGVRLTQLSTSWKDIKESFGESIINSEFFKNIIGWLGNLNKAGSDTRITSASQAWKMMKPNNYQKFTKDQDEITRIFGITKYPDAFTNYGQWEGFSAPQKYIETIATLNEKLKDEKDYLVTIDITNKSAIETQVKIIDGLEKQIKALTEYKRVAIEISKADISKFVYPERLVYMGELGRKIKFPTMEGLRGKPVQPIKDMTESMDGQIDIIKKLQSTFEALFVNVGGGFKGMAESLINSIKMITTELLAKAAIFTIMKFIFPEAFMDLPFHTLGKFLFGGKFASGTNFAPGGLSMVGERGPELINLPRGSQVIPYKNQSMRIEIVGKISGKDLSLVMRRQNGI
jgi:hypothetical protein